MKRFIFINLIAILLICSTNVLGQTKSTTEPKRKLRLIVKPTPKPKVEAEIWKEFQSKEISIKASFPKTPTVTKNAYNDGLVDVKSTVIQAYLNQNFYMVEVREYPPNFLPKDENWTETFGEWFRNYILEGNKVYQEGIFDFGNHKVAEFVYQQTEKDILAHRALVIGQKLYQQIIQLEIKNSDSLQQTIEKNKEKIDKFFGSLVISEEIVTDKTTG